MINYISYRIGIKKLQEIIGKQHEKYLDVTNYQNQLLENLNEVESFGDNENLRSNRYKLLNQIDKLALETTGKEFSQFCKPDPIEIKLGEPTSQDDAVWHKFQEPEMFFIPPGPFIMGSPAELDPDASESEYPLHVVNLSAFYIASEPVTNVQFATFTIDTNHTRPDHWNGQLPSIEIHDHPIVNISWHSAFAFCNWLRNLTHKNYRLPTEAEWEKAARGEHALLFPWGNKWEINYANTHELRLEKTTSVNNFPNAKSPYGLLNMSGNVYEWTSSLWDTTVYNYPYIPNDDRESLERPSDASCVIRGGSFLWNKKYARCASRSSLRSNRSRQDVGFRLALSPFRSNPI